MTKSNPENSVRGLTQQLTRQSVIAATPIQTSNSSCHDVRKTSSSVWNQQHKQPHRRTLARLLRSSSATSTPPGEQPGSGCCAASTS